MGVGSVGQCGHAGWLPRGYCAAKVCGSFAGKRHDIGDHPAAELGFRRYLRHLDETGGFPVCGPDQ